MADLWSHSQSAKDCIDVLFLTGKYDDEEELEEWMEDDGIVLLTEIMLGYYCAIGNALNFLWRFGFVVVDVVVLGLVCLVCVYVFDVFYDL